MSNARRCCYEATLYTKHVLALFAPGARVEGLKVHPGGAQPLDSWAGDELKLLIEEGRRQLDRQRSELDRIQGRCQFLFTTCLALLAIVVAGTSNIQTKGFVYFLPWYLSLLLTLVSLLGAASVLAVRSEFGAIDPTLLSQIDHDQLRSTAEAYAQQNPIGANTIATKLTIYRDAVTLLLFAAVLQSSIWLAAHS